MKKTLTLMFLLFIMCAGLSAQSFGTGLTVWIPETLWKSGEGSVSLENGVDSSLGLGSLISLPFGLTYLKAHGLRPDGSSQAYNYESADGSWYLADVLVAHLGIQARADFAGLYFKAQAAAAGSWLISLSPFSASIEQFYKNTAGSADAHISGLTTDYRFGWGWTAGGAIGMRIDALEVEISAAYRSISHEGMFRAGLLLLDDGGNVTSNTDLTEQVALVLRGLSIGLGGSFSF